MIDYKNHWDNVYSKSELNKLGWYEVNPKPSMDLINLCKLKNDAAILDVGSGTTTLLKKLIASSFTNITATDISAVALNKAKNLLSDEEADRVKWIADDITNPKNIQKIDKVDLWHDRTVLHFLVEEEARQGYLNTLKKLVNIGGYVIIAVFSLEGAKKCSGLDVKNYSCEMIQSFLGNEFNLIHNFDHLYEMPSGDKRPYIYTLFKRLKKI
jgi:SAM-dependent methyltransferase